MKIKEQKREKYAQSISELALPRHPLTPGIHRGPLRSNGLDEFEPTSGKSVRASPLNCPVLILTQPLPGCYCLFLNQLYWQKCPPSYHLIFLSFRLDPFCHIETKKKGKWLFKLQGPQNSINARLDLMGHCIPNSLFSDVENESKGK